MLEPLDMNELRAHRRRLERPRDLRAERLGKQAWITLLAVLTLMGVFWLLTETSNKGRCRRQCEGIASIVPEEAVALCVQECTQRANGQFTELTRDH